jgi:hypothetical protein
MGVTSAHVWADCYHDQHDRDATPVIPPVRVPDVDVTIVIPNLNGASVLPATLHAVAAGAGSLAYEVILVDNASTDDSVAWVLENHPSVTVLPNAENLGFAAA